MPSNTFFHLPAQKRAKLLEAAWAEFTRVTFADASINKIIRGAKIPRGSFYMYFADKADLFQYLLGQYGVQLSDLIERLLLEQSGDPFAAFLDLFDFIQRDYRSASPHVPYSSIMEVVRLNGIPQLETLFGGHPPILRRLAEQIDRDLLDLQLDSDLEDMLNILLSATGPAICRGIFSENPASVRTWYQRILSILARGMTKAPAPALSQS